MRQARRAAACAALIVILPLAGLSIAVGLAALAHELHARAEEAR